MILLNSFVSKTCTYFSTLLFLCPETDQLQRIQLRGWMVAGEEERAQTFFITFITSQFATLIVFLTFFIETIPRVLLSGTGDNVL